MHPSSVREEALWLVDAGVNDCEISRRLDVPRTTVREWRAPHYVPQDRDDCPRCWRAAKPMWFTPEDYAFLLGMYLGDGCISRMGRTYRLRISLDTKYPGIIDAVERALRRCLPLSPVGRQLADRGSCTVVGVYGNHLPCLFPQHGPGKKHLRKIALEDWQLRMVWAAPWALLRGLVWSDGSSFTNRTGRYEYLSFEFTNLSDDLIRLFADACELVDVTCRAYIPRTVGGKRRKGQVRMNRRDAVALFVKHVGIKR